MRSSWFTAPMTRVRIHEDGSDYTEFEGLFSLNLENLSVIRWGDAGQTGWAGIQVAAFREIGEGAITYYCIDLPSLRSLLAYFGVPLDFWDSEDDKLEVIEAVE